MEEKREDKKEEKKIENDKKEEEKSKKEKPQKEKEDKKEKKILNPRKNEAKKLVSYNFKKKNNNKIINEIKEILITANKKQIIKKIHGTKKDDKENSSSKNKNTLEFSSNIMSSSKNDWKLGPSGSKKK